MDPTERAAVGLPPEGLGGTGRPSQALIDEIVRRVLSVARAERIILFGSAARGTMTKDSDVDVLVLEEDPTDLREERIKIYEALMKLGPPFDVIVMSTRRFELMKNLIGGIAYPANKEGRVIYGPDRGSQA